jgi:hypothetical protein
MKASDIPYGLLRQIARDAKVDPRRLIGLVKVSGRSILEAVALCQDADMEADFIAQRKAAVAARKDAKAERIAKAKAGGWRVKRQKAADAYVADAWRLDVR